MSDNLNISRQRQCVSQASCMIVVATDAPLSDRNLKRLAKRAFNGMARTTNFMANSSGDYAIAFSTARAGKLVTNDAMSPLFLAAIEATEEAIYNSLFKATTMTGRNGVRVEALPLDRTIEILKKYGVVNR